jgi:D-alanine-D-alanine ligase
VHRSRWEGHAAEVTAELTGRLPPPWFTKPVRQGSSIGISKVTDVAGLPAAMLEAYAHDDVAIIEQGFEGARELEVGVLGHDHLDVTRPGEIVSDHEFYDFDAKYLSASQLLIPADVPADMERRIDELARVAYRAIGCRGMARIDFFADRAGRVMVNEINTIPGFTPSSMFPQLWAAEGLDYPALVDRLLADATV